MAATKRNTCKKKYLQDKINIAVGNKKQAVACKKANKVNERK